jgi:formylglycine-generating enzyme required for sulfatase activity
MFQFFSVRTLSFCILAFAVGNGVWAADVFQMPQSVKSLEFVTVGNPGNEPDSTTGNKSGSVKNVYGIGKYDVTAGQYCEFLNAVAANADPHELYNPAMETNPRGCKIIRSKTDKGFSYAVDPAIGDHPVNFVSWGDAARFCNWLHNGQKSDPATLEDGAYALQGKTDREGLMAVERKKDAKYFLPDANEWYKAAYYTTNKNGKPGYWKYPMQSDEIPSNELSAKEKNNANFEKNGFTVPPKGAATPVGAFAGSPGPSGTFDQGGNVWQWIETASGEWTRSMRGGAFVLPYSYLESKSKGDHSPTYEEYHLGFRVAKAVEAGK